VALRDVQDLFETALEPIGGGFGSTSINWGAYVAPGNPFTVGSFFSPVVEPSIAIAAPPSLPTVRVVPPATPENGSPGTFVGDPAVQVIDPEFEPQTTVFESKPSPYFAERTRGTDWDAMYEQWVILNAPVVFSDPSVLIPPVPPPVVVAPAPPPVPVVIAPTTTTEDDVAFHGSIDWGSAVGTIIGGILDPVGIGAAATSFFQPGTTVTGIPSLGQQTSLAAPTIGAVQMQQGSRAKIRQDLPRYWCGDPSSSTSP